MVLTGRDLWDRYRSFLWHDPDLEMQVDVSRMNLTRDFVEALRPRMTRAFRAMQELESGAIANPDEHRMVGHYWLRDPSLAPFQEIGTAIRDVRDRVQAFAEGMHSGEILTPEGHRFTRFLLLGIGGSALGPQFVAHALGGPWDRMRPHFIDNTDPDGMDEVMRELGSELRGTLVIVVSKSGGTKETRNAAVEVEAMFRKLGLSFSKRAVAVTGEGSALERSAREQGYREIFPMWEWVGGRTSEFSAVGLLPAALQGIDIEAFLEGARVMDQRTRVPDLLQNPAALLAASWYAAGNSRGDRDMVVLPYKDRLILLSRYLQQLVMESLGKERDLDGHEVHQGLVVYGNKGSTDQHAYVQQLRDGPNNFFATFVGVRKDREGRSPTVEDDITSGDYLLGFMLGTRRALYEKGRASITIMLPDLSPRAVGALIALYERAVGLYASLINVNAYNQPGVEAGKEAAEEVLALERRILDALHSEPERRWSLGELAGHLGENEDMETIFHVLEHLAANPDHGVTKIPGQRPWENTYRMT
ncbi:MAG TPA: glucose-6-phosphate isomerase [Candidatus Eisenbacteria bacterium]|nr:glucose-6-phosphate isomerase [Candidatus Eisenbacteria bacterium]